MGLISDIKKILTLNCEESARLLSTRQDSSLGRTEQLALRLHLMICRACRRYNKQLQFIRKLFQALHKKDMVSSEFKISDEKRKHIKKMVNEKSDFE
jgi:hypothetical protein